MRVVALGALAAGAVGRFVLTVVRRRMGRRATGSIYEILYDSFRGFLVRTVMRWGAGPENAERYRQFMMEDRGLPPIDVPATRARMGRYLGDALYVDPPPPVMREVEPRRRRARRRGRGRVLASGSARGAEHPE